MGEVLRLAAYSNQDMVALVRAILVGTLNGDVTGIDIHWVTKDGRERHGSAGRHGTHNSDASQDSFFGV